MSIDEAEKPIYDTLNGQHARAVARAYGNALVTPRAELRKLDGCVRI